MKKQLLLFVMILLPMVASADAVEIDGIYYNLIAKGKVAEVAQNPNNYSGSVEIPESVTYEGVNYSVTTIGSFAFMNCYYLTSIIIPNSITTIRSCAFASAGIESIAIPSSVISIGANSFSGCNNLTSVHISDLVAWCKLSFSNYGMDNPLSYAHHLYLNGEEIKDLVIPNNITSIGNYAFYGCSDLTSVTIPNSVTSIGEGAFSGCSGLTSVIIGDGVTSIGVNAFSYCSGLNSVIIPNSVVTIDDCAFRSCSNLTSVTIPNSVKNIGFYTFYDCQKLNSITIGNGIESIESGAFESCPELTDVYCYAKNIPNANSDVFKDSYIEYMTLHVPSASVNAYGAAEPWKNFKEIIALTDSDPKPTSIDMVRSKISDIRDAYFNLNGHRLTGEPTLKGVYIHNGKKIILK